MLKTCKQKKPTTTVWNTTQKIVKAIGGSWTGTMNVAEASKVFDIPRQTLSHRIKEKYTKVGGGRKTELTEDE